MNLSANSARFKHQKGLKMHEYSIIQSLLDMCEEHAKNNNAKEVSKVTVKIGVLSGIEPHLLQVAFDTFKENTICEKSEFIMQIQKIIINCNKCNTQSEIEKNEFICPACKSTDIKAIDGEDLQLLNLELTI